MELSFTPSKWQQDVIANFKRFNVLVVHRGAGKSWLCAQLLKMSALSSKEKLPVYAYIAPELAQGKKIAFDQLSEGLQDIAKINYQEAWIQFHHNGAKIYVIGLSDAERLRGLHLDGCVCDEFGDIPEEVYSRIIRPTLERKKAWCVMIGTPKNADNLLKLYYVAKDDPDLYQAVWLTAYDTLIYSKDQIDALKREYQARGDYASFCQEYLNDPIAILDSYYYRDKMVMADKSGRIGEFPYQPGAPVIAAWDLGADGTAIWFAQKIKGKVNLIDYLEFKGAKLDIAMGAVASKDFTIAHHILPWDAGQERVNAEYSIQAQFRNYGWKVNVLKKPPIKLGIMEASTLIKVCNFDKDACKIGIECLMNYSAKVDKQTGMVLPAPKHDKYSHGADAFRYLALGLKSTGPDTLSTNITVDNNYNYLDIFK